MRGDDVERRRVIGCAAEPLRSSHASSLAGGLQGSGRAASGGGERGPSRALGQQAEGQSEAPPFAPSRDRRTSEQPAAWARRHPSACSHLTVRSHVKPFPPLHGAGEVRRRRQLLRKRMRRGEDGCTGRAARGGSAPRDDERRFAASINISPRAATVMGWRGFARTDGPTNNTWSGCPPSQIG